MRSIEIGPAIEKIVADVADDHGLVGVRNILNARSKLSDDLGMDEVDVIAIVCRAEDRFGVALPDHRIEPSSTVGDIVAMVADRLQERAAVPSRITRPDVPDAPDLAGVRSRADGNESHLG